MYAAFYIILEFVAMSIHVKKYTIFLLFGALCGTVILSYAMESNPNLLLSNNMQQQPLQLLTAEQRTDRARLCSFEEMPHEIQNAIACDMIADFFIVPQRMLSDSKGIESLSMYGDMIATSHMFHDKDVDLFAPPKTEVKIWHIDGTLLQTFECPYVVPPKVSIGKDKLVIALYDEVRVIDLSTGQSLYSFVQGENVQSLTLSDNKIIVISPRRINIWDIQNGKLKRPKIINAFLSRLLNGFSSFAISNGKIVGTDGRIAQIWNMNTGELQHTLEDMLIKLYVLL